MKFRVVMKTPDILEDKISELTEALSEDEDYRDYLLTLCKRWFRYNELIVLEIDTDEKTCVVLDISSI